MIDPMIAEETTKRTAPGAQPDTTWIQTTSAWVRRNTIPKRYTDPSGHQLMPSIKRWERSDATVRTLWGPENPRLGALRERSGA